MRDSNPEVQLTAGRLTIEGKSRAGNETWFKVRELGVGLDIGRGPDAMIGVRDVFVTHAHLDHALGIPSYAAQRGLQGLEPGNLYLPAETIDNFAELMRLHERLEGVRYELNLVGMRPGETIRVRRDLLVRAHRTSHRVSSIAFEFVEVRHRLKTEFAGQPEQKLVELRQNGHAITEESEHSSLIYTGDTDREVLNTCAALFATKVLMIECSFVTPGHRERAASYRHIHLEDLWDFADRFENEWIVLTHFSLRYSPAEINEHISRSCPERLRERILLALPEPFVRLLPTGSGEVASSLQ